MRATVTYETLTDESAEHGDFHDHGWIAPNEMRARLGLAGRNYGKRVRMAQRGRYDWSFGAAVRYILERAQYVQSMVDVDCQTWERVSRAWVVLVDVERTHEDDGDRESVGYQLSVKGLSQGTADRLERLLINRGCRRPHARASSFRHAR